MQPNYVCTFDSGRHRRSLAESKPGATMFDLRVHCCNMHACTRSAVSLRRPYLHGLMNFIHNYYSLPAHTRPRGVDLPVCPSFGRLVPGYLERLDDDVGLGSRTC